MFNFITRDEVYALQKQNDDLRRQLAFERAERDSTERRIRLQAELDGQNKRLKYIEDTFSAEANYEAAEGRKQAAEEYAEKAVKQAEKCAADFGNATAKMMEKVIDLLKTIKPAEAAKLNILPAIGSSTEVKLTK